MSSLASAGFIRVEPAHQPDVEPDQHRQVSRQDYGMDGESSAVRLQFDDHSPQTGV